MLAGCGPDDAWHRLDLARLPPLVDDQPAAEPVVPTLEPLGEGLRRRGLQVTGQVDALRARVGASLSWSLDLGAEPYLSFVPIVPPDDACPPTYVVEASARAAERMELARFAPRPASGLPAVFGRGAIELPLDDLADRRATLVLRTEASCRGGPTDVSWGSPAVWHRRRAPRPPGSPERPNVLLLSIDTLRADHLGAWGADPSETPALDGLAAESDVWTQAFSTFNVTNPSFASISTGLYGKNHGVYDLRTPLPEAHETLAERFQGAGWRTGAVVSVRHLEASQSGLGQGFED
ncbi:MAG: sulfatase-like hydrolase/transferase, partial [Acidobacteriota bacterium]